MPYNLQASALLDAADKAILYKRLTLAYLWYYTTLLEWLT
jgi:hypothetical protein